MHPHERKKKQFGFSKLYPTLDAYGTSLTNTNTNCYAQACSNNALCLCAKNVKVGVVVEVRPHSSHGVGCVRDGARDGRRVVLEINVVETWNEPVRPSSGQPLDLVRHYFPMQNLIIHCPVQVGHPPAVRSGS